MQVTLRPEKSFKKHGRKEADLSFAKSAVDYGSPGRVSILTSLGLKPGECSSALRVVCFATDCDDLLAFVQYSCRAFGTHWNVPSKSVLEQCDSLCCREEDEVQSSKETLC